MQETETNTSREDQASTPVCPNCLADLKAADDFCGRCGSPISGISVLDPLKHVYAAGWMYRKATRGRPRLIVLVGIWLVFGPGVLLSAIGFLAELPGRQWWVNEFSFTLEDVLGLLVFAGVISLNAAILLKVTAAYFGRSWSDLKGDTAEALGTCFSCLLAALAILQMRGGRLPDTWTVLLGLFAFSLSTTLCISGLIRLVRRKNISPLTIFCLVGNVLLIGLMIAILFR